MRKFQEWFSPETRQKIQAFVVTVAPIAIMLGYGTEGQWQQWLVILGATIAALGSLLSLLNVRVTDWSTQGWAIVRGVLYGLGTVVSPALVALGYINEDTNAKVLTGLSLGITALSSAISIFVNGQQQKTAAVETVLGITPKSDPGKMPDVAAVTPASDPGNIPFTDPDGGVH
jgi:hypothetical protein